MDVKQHFLRELKEEGLLIIRHISGTENTADLFTKNLTGSDFQKHVSKICGDSTAQSNVGVGEDVGVQMCDSKY